MPPLPSAHITASLFFFNLNASIKAACPLSMVHCFPGFSTHPYMGTVLSQILEALELAKWEECFHLSFDRQFLLEEPQSTTARIPHVSQDSLLEQFSFSIPLRAPQVPSTRLWKPEDNSKTWTRGHTIKLFSPCTSSKTLTGHSWWSWHPVSMVWIHSSGPHSESSQLLRSITQNSRTDILGEDTHRLSCRLVSSIAVSLSKLWTLLKSSAF